MMTEPRPKSAYMRARDRLSKLSDDDLARVIRTTTDDRELSIAHSIKISREGKARRAREKVTE